MTKLSKNIEALVKVAGQDVGEIKEVLHEINSKLTPQVETVEVEKEVIRYVDRPVEKIVEKIVHVPTGSALFKHYRVELSTTFEWYYVPIPEEFNGKEGLIFIKEDGATWSLEHQGEIDVQDSPRISENDYQTEAKPCEVLIVITNSNGLEVLEPTDYSLH